MCWTVGGVEKHLVLHKTKSKNEIHSNPIDSTRKLVESVNGASLTLEGVHDIQRRHRLPLRVFGVGHGVFDHILQKGLDHRSGFLINLSRDPLHSASPRQSPDGWLGDSGNVSFAALSESLSSSLSQSFTSFSSARHIEIG